MPQGVVLPGLVWESREAFLRPPRSSSEGVYQGLATCWGRKGPLGAGPPAVLVSPGLPVARPGLSAPGTLYLAFGSCSVRVCLSADCVTLIIIS